MRSKLTAGVVLLSSIGVAMAQAPTAITVRQAELSKHPFDIGQLKLTVEKLSNWGQIRVRVENQSDSAVVFDPQFLSLVSNGSEQVNTAGYRGQSLPLRKVLPGAFLKEAYLLDHKVKLPARLYYDGKELAVIIE